MDPIGALVRISHRASPALAARLDWMRERHRHNVSLRIMEHLVHRGDFVVDIGASWGLYGWQLARLVGPRGQVHVIEPNPGATRSLNAIRGRRRNIVVHAVALSDRPGEAQLHIPVVEGRDFEELGSLAVPRTRAPVEHRRVAVPVGRLDDVLPADSPPVAFVKCDVEGHELSVLRGGEVTLHRWRPAILIEVEQRHQTHGRIEETFAHLLGYGYAGYAVHEAGIRPLDEFDVERDQLRWLGPDFMPYAMPAAYVHDFLFVHPGTDVAPLLSPRPRARAPRSGPSRPGRTP